MVKIERENPENLRGTRGGVVGLFLVPCTLLDKSKNLEFHLWLRLSKREPRRCGGGGMYST